MVSIEKNLIKRYRNYETLEDKTEVSIYVIYVSSKSKT